MIVVLLSSLLRLSCALPTTPNTKTIPVLSSTDLLHSTVQEWSSEDIKFLDNLLPLGEREVPKPIDEEMPSRYNDMKLFDGHDLKPAPLELPIPIIETSSTITTTPSFFDIDITSSRRISLDNTEQDSINSSESAQEPKSIISQEVTPVVGRGKIFKKVKENI
jgi:hypothetical protein